jgi:hypothetical protein
MTADIAADRVFNGVLRCSHDPKRNASSYDTNTNALELAKVPEVHPDVLDKSCVRGVLEERIAGVWGITPRSSTSSRLKSLIIDFTRSITFRQRKVLRTRCARLLLKM